MLFTFHLLEAVVGQLEYHLACSSL